MKKRIYFLLAALVATTCLFAQRPTRDGNIKKALPQVNFDFTNHDLDDWNVTDATLNTDESSSATAVYDIQAGVEAVAYCNGFDGILFKIKNSSDKAKAFSIRANNCFEFGGKNGVIVFKDTYLGQVIQITVAAKGSTDANFKDANNVYPKNAVNITADLTLPAKDPDQAGIGDYDENGYCWKTLTFISSGGDVEIKEFAAGYRIKFIQTSNFSGGGVPTTYASDALTAGSALANNATSDQAYVVSGCVVEAESFSCALGNQTVWIAEDASETDPAKMIQGFMCSVYDYNTNINVKMLVGDHVLLFGYLTKENSTIKLKNGFGWISSIYDSSDPEHYVPTVYRHASVEDVLDISTALSDGEYTDDSFWVVGYVSNIENDLYASEGVQIFWISDDKNSTANTNADGAYQVYRGTPEGKAVQVGDRVKVLTRIHKDATSLVNTETFARVAFSSDDEQFPECYVTLSMADAYGDGWNGGFLTVTDGTFTKDYSLFSNNSSRGNDLIPYYGKPMHFSWTQGSWSDEVSFSILNPFDQPLYEHSGGGSFDSESDFYTLYDPCGLFPTEADLTAAGYDLSTNVVFCVKFIDDATVCNDIYFIGTPSGGALGTDVPFQPLTGFDGWYVASYPYESGFWGKPIHVDYEGYLTWDYQCGDVDAWSYAGGNALDLTAGYSGECNVAFGSAGAYIYKLSYWKFHGNPCKPVVYRDYTVKLYAPNVCDEVPAIIGDFNSWDLYTPVKMTESVDASLRTIYTATIHDRENHTFKIVNMPDPGNPVDWNDDIFYYNEYDATWYPTNNIVLGEEEEIVLDWDDYNHYRFGYCTEETARKVVVAIILPTENMPEEGAEIIGTFNNWLDDASDVPAHLTPYEEMPGVYYAIIDAKSTDYFKIREINNSNNEILRYDDMLGAWVAINNGDLTCGQLWINAATINAAFDGYKGIYLDMSEASEYKWKLLPPICNYQMVLRDKYNDSWDGNGYMIVKDGDFEMTFTCLRGESPKTVKVPYYGNDVTFTWGDGSCTGEISISVLTSNGMEIFCHPQGNPMSAGELLYTMQVSPCKEGQNPFVPQNLQVSLTEEHRIAATWDAVTGAASYRVTLVRPSGYSYEMNTTVLYAASPVMYENGEYKIFVASLNAEGLQLGEASTTYTMDLPVLEEAEVTLLMPSDCGIDISAGMWIKWKPSNESTWHIDPMTQDGPIFTAKIKPFALMYDVRFINNTDDTNPNYKYSEDAEELTAAQVCFEAQYSDWEYFDLNQVQCDALADHNYTPKNLQATAATGYVTFKWEAEDIAERYYIYMYDASTDNYITGFYLSDFNINEGVIEYNWGVESSLNGTEIYWYVQAASPYYTAYVNSTTNVTLLGGSVTLSDLSLTTADNITLDASWTPSDPGLKYLVEVRYNSVPVKREIIAANEYHYTALVPSRYCYVYVTPLDADNELPVGTRYELGEVNLSKAPEPFAGITGVANGHDLSFSWTSFVPKAMVGLYQKVGDNYQVIYEAESSTNVLDCTVAADGQYVLALSPFVEYETGKFSLLGYEQTVAVTTFSSETYHVEINCTEGGQIEPTNPSGDYPFGYALSFGVRSQSGYVFTGWSDGETDEYRYLVVTGDTAITANFVKLVTLTITHPENGYIEYSGEYYDDDYYTDRKEYYLIPGTKGTITAYPNSGYQFVQWNDGVKTINRTITVTEDIAFNAIFDVLGASTQWEVDIKSESTAKGSVSDVNGYHYEGTILEVTATPRIGFKFDKWSDDVTDNPREITVNGDINLTAYFTELTYTLNVSAGEGGSVDPEGEITGLKYGESKVIKAIPSSGYEFANWSDGNVLDERQITITQDCTLVANFKEVVLPITYSFALGTNVGNGTVTSSIPEGDYAPDTEITVTATPATGWKFVKWSNESTVNPLTFNLTSDVTIYAVFKDESVAPESYTFAFSVDGVGGTVASDHEAGTYEEGTSITLTATPQNADWALESWTINGTPAGTTNPLTITLTQNTEVVAKFVTTKTYKVTVAVDGSGGTVKPTGYNKKSVLGGTSLKIEAIPDEGYKFDGWSDGESDAERTIIITQDTVLKASFSDIVYYKLTVDISPEGAGTVKVDGKSVSKWSSSYAEGTTVRLAAEPATGYVFDYYQDGNDDIETEEYNVKMTKKRSITVYFKKDTRDLDNIDASTRATKILINGEIYILRGDKIYTVQGQLVK